MGHVKKLVKINLGNISNQELIIILTECMDSIIDLDSKNQFLIEVSKNSISIIRP